MPVRDARLRQTNFPQALHAATIETPFGAFAIHVAGELIHELLFLPPGTPILAPRTALAARAAEQLAAWLEDPDRPFDLPLAPRGTAFQRRVWQAIAAIPRGRVSTYGAISREVGGAARAVGQACGANPFPIVVPCHRVVSASGLGGFAGSTDGYLMDTKRWLLAFEATR